VTTLSRAAGLQSLFEDHAGIEILIGDAAAPDGSRSWLDETVQVVVLGAQSTLETSKIIASMRTRRPDLRIIVMSPATGDEAILSALSLGAKGFLHDSATVSEFENAIQVVASGSIWASRRILALLVERLLAARDAGPTAATASFTPREQEVLSLLLEGQSNREIAISLKIEERTVKAYVAKLMAKVGVNNRTALSMKAFSTEHPT